MPKGLKEISKITGYSISTVSRVLSNKISGNSKSAKEILAVARRLGYSKYRTAKPSNNRTLDIALVTEHYSEEFYAYLYASFDLICSNNDYSLTIHSIRHAHNISDQLTYLSQTHDGIILFLPSLDLDGYKSTKKILHNYPTISIAPAFEVVFDTFTFDSYQGGTLAAKQLLKEGYKKFGVINGPRDKWEAALRKSGFTDTIYNAGFTIIWQYDGDYSFEAGEEAYHDIRNENLKNIGIFTSNDQMAVGFIHAALEHSQWKRGQYGIIGYDNILFSKIFFPKLTTIHTNIDHLASESLSHIARMIKAEVSVNALPRKTLIPVSIRTRDTHQK